MVYPISVELFANRQIAFCWLEVRLVYEAIVKIKIVFLELPMGKNRSFLAGKQVEHR